MLIDNLIFCMGLESDDKRDDVEDKETAESHFGVVMGRFAELLNCHFADLASYKTYL